MKNFYPALVATFLLCSCSSFSQTKVDRNVTFSCINGETVSVRFLPDEDIAILSRNGTDLTLPEQRTGSGFIYSTGRYTIHGKGDDLTIEIGRMAPIQCRAKSA